MEISVIIPVYNKEAYLDKCFESVFSQDFDSFEVVAVDDGSTDLSGTICDRWAEQEKRLHVVHTPNGGVTAARRLGLERSKGRFIMFADADDLFLPHAFSLMHQAICDSNADEVISPYQDQYGRIHDSGLRGFQSCEPLVRNLLRTKNSFCVLWGIIFRRDLLDGCLQAPREIVEREDSLMQIKCLIKQPRVYFIKEACYLHYEDVPNNRTESLQWIRIYDNELRQTLQCQWETYRYAFVGHQIKIYEKFIEKRQFQVFNEYYRPLRQQLHHSIPLKDRIVILLPPRVSYILIYTYKRILKWKQ